MSTQLHKSVESKKIVCAQIVMCMGILYVWNVSEEMKKQLEQLEQFNCGEYDS